ncbi:peptidase family M48-domain-containing protein [Rhodocollybia butyracea]|uniref:CAAX prenyl protease n=1 Tax=Rhodocollybia butyracea TaxID=206335 RepID=A0A9P5PUA5_9AGAR|nr:peptidase family M48-domain-containing protein [Rhodocollybia butyracea]
MDFLHSGLAAVQRHLAFVSVDPINWKFYVQVFSWGVTIFESYLLLRQYPLYSKTSPPEALASHITQEDFEKSQKYGKDKAKFSIFSKLFSQCVDSAMLQYGFYAWCWGAAGTILGKFGYGTDYEILQSIIFSFTMYLLSSLPTLPLSIYSTFWIEERHGFNKTTPGLFVTDLLKSWLVAFALGAPFLAAFLYIFKWAGDRFVPWLMGFMISFQLLMVIFLYSNKLTPLSEGELRTRVESLAGKLRFPLKHLYEIDGSKRSSHSNAYFFGLPWSKHIVIFDTLIQQSKPEEVEAVLAHELGHWYYLHPTKMMAISQIHIFTILAPLSCLPACSSMILTPLEAFISIGMNAVSRHFEWEADRFACELQDKLNEKSMNDMGDRLGRALITLHVKNLSTVWVDWLYSAYHHSHPTLIERLRGLESFRTKRAKKE